MADLDLTTRIGLWDEEETLRRARLAAGTMGLGISGERSDGFKVGDQWFGAFEIEIWTDQRWNGTEVRIEARTHKVGYGDKLHRAVLRFLELIRSPGTKSPAAPATPVQPAAPAPAQPLSYSESDYWQWEPEEEPEAAREQLPYAIPVAVIFYGVVAGLITEGIIEGGKYIVREVRDREGNETKERPDQIYDPETKQVWHKQADGSYQPTGQRLD